MSKVKFYPWVGDQYKKSQFGIKILVLGESSYQWNEDEPINDNSLLTQELIAEQISGVYSKSFWTNIAIAFLGHKPILSEKFNFWHSVSFYNYVQESVGMGARVRPSPEKWENSKDAFGEVLESLSPDLIVVLGYQLWEHIPDLSGRDGPVIDGAPRSSTWFYSHSNGSCLAIGIKHPSSGFNGRDWHSYIKKGIEIQS